MAARAWQAGAACGAALLLLAAACRQLVGIGDDPPTDRVDGAAAAQDGGADVDGSPSSLFPEGGCGACVSASCADAAAACADNLACSALASCYGACQQDIACRVRCVAEKFVGTAPQAPALFTCLQDRCREACGLGCGAFPFTTEVDAGASCATCMSGSPCGAQEACFGDPDCESVVFCTLATYTEDSRQECSDGREAGAALYTATYNAYQNACATPCDVGQNWYCIGRVNWPMAPSARIVTTVSVQDYFQRTPVPGTTVTACSAVDERCSALVASGNSDPGGNVALTVSDLGAVANGFLGYFEVGSVEAGAPTDLFPELDFTGFPLTEPASRWPLGVLTRSELDSLLPSGVALDPTRGHVFMLARDCVFGPAGGSTFTVPDAGADSGAQLFYSQGLSFVPGATATDRVLASAMLVNAPPGPIELTVRPQALDGAASSDMTVFVRAGWLSVVTMVPTP